METMDDTPLVEAAQAGNEDAFAELYRRHFDSVYDFAARMARGPGAGAEVAEAAFLATMMALQGLRPGDSFRARLFATARSVALSHLERTRAVHPGSHADKPGFDLVDSARLASPGAIAAASDIAPLVWEAALALDPRQLSLLDLQLRQGLGNGEIAAVLDITQENARVLLARVDAAAEDRLVAFIMAARDRDGCARLGAALAAIDTSTASLALRRMVARHLSLCPLCQERRRRLAPPLAVFAALQAIAPDDGTRERILDNLMRRWPVAAVLRQRAEDGGAAVIGPPWRPPGRGAQAGRRPVLALSGLGSVIALLAVALLFPASPFALTVAGQDDAPSPDPNGLAPLPSATRSPASNRLPATATATLPTSIATNAAPGAGTPGAVGQSPIAGATPTATPTAGPTSTGTPPPTATSTHTPVSTPTSIPCVPRLATNGISQVFLAPGGTGSFFVYDAQLCGPLSFATSASSWLAVAPAAGSFAYADKAEVTVTAPAGDLAEGPHTGVVTVAGVPNGGQVTVTVIVTVTGNPPEILSANCAVTGGSWSFTVQARDDFAVTSAALRYVNGGGNVTVPLVGPNGQSSGEWAATIAADATAHDFSVTVRDAAGQAAIATVPGCS